MGEGGRAYAQIHYNPDNPDEAVVREVREEEEKSAESEEIIEAEEVLKEEPEEELEEESEKESEEEPEEENAEMEEAMEENAEETEINPEQEFENLSESEIFEEKSKEPVQLESGQDVSAEARDRMEQSVIAFDCADIKAFLTKQESMFDDISLTLRRLEKKFADEILNGENRDSAVKTMYKEMNDYKAGIVEKALKNVIYDIIDIRETMLSQSKFLREKKEQDVISLEEFESYADDLGDILEKHDVSIYKGKLGEENVAVRQKITRKVETEDESRVRTVAESLSYGYEYGGKVLYPERISVYVKKK